jgi:hypothetical protein
MRGSDLNRGERRRQIFLFVECRDDDADFHKKSTLRPSNLFTRTGTFIPTPRPRPKKKFKTTP